MVSEKPGSMSIVEDESPIESHETEFCVGERAVRIRIDVVTEFNAHGEPHIESTARVWVDGEEVKDARVFDSGPEMFNIAFPREHPIVKDHTRTHWFVGEYESNIIEIPQDYHQRTVQSYTDAYRRLLSEKWREIERFEVNISLVDTSVDEGILRARTKLTSTLGSATVKYHMTDAAELDWTFADVQGVPDDHFWLLHTAARLLAPIDHDDYIGKVVLNSQSADDSGGGGSR